MRIASLLEERWPRKTAEWDRGLDNCTKTNRSVGRPRKRSEDEINEFIKMEEIDKFKGNDSKNNDTWLQQAKQKKRTESKRRRIRKTDSSGKKS